MQYNQFCPVAKASELLGEKWTFLILRELLSGGRRFNEFQRGLGHISPSLLSTRLRQLEEGGIIERNKIKGQQGYEYFLTQAGNEVLPIVKELGKWGMKWARTQIEDEELDIELLMLYLVRSIKPKYLAGNETIIHFKFNNLKKLQNWWIIVKDYDIDVCLEDPKKEVDVWFNTDVRTMMEVWMGDRSYRSAIEKNKLTIIGRTSLTKSITKWLHNSDYATNSKKETFSTK